MPAHQLSDGFTSCSTRIAHLHHTSRTLECLAQAVRMSQCKHASSPTVRWLHELQHAHCTPPPYITYTRVSGTGSSNEPVQACQLTNCPKASRAAARALHTSTIHHVH